MTYLKPYQLPTTHLALSPAVFVASRPAMGSSTTSRCLAARGLKGHAGTGPAAEDVHAQTRTWTVTRLRLYLFSAKHLAFEKVRIPGGLGRAPSRYALCFWHGERHPSNFFRLFYSSPHFGSVHDNSLLTVRIGLHAHSVNVSWEGSTVVRGVTRHYNSLTLAMSVSFFCIPGVSNLHSQNVLPNGLTESGFMDLYVSRYSWGIFKLGLAEENGWSHIPQVGCSRNNSLWSTKKGYHHLE